MLHRTQTIYKGDVLAGSFYLLIGVLALLAGILLYCFTERLGLYYLSIGLIIFSIYMLGKGSVMMFMYWSRFRYYKSREQISQENVRDEIKYTDFRISKKHRNRRLYMYIILAGSLIAFGGLFHQEKGLILGTSIPIILLSAIEFSIGLLTEFRLSEYLRQLKR